MICNRGSYRCRVMSELWLSQAVERAEAWKSCVSSRWALAVEVARYSILRLSSMQRHRNVFWREAGLATAMEV
jgi:hypothetical protein